MIFPAKLLSIFLGPAVLWPVTLLILLLKANLTADHLIILLSALFFLQVLVPLIFVYAAFRLKKINDLDLTRRKERYTPVFVTLVCLLSSLPVIYFYGNRTLFSLFLLLTILVFVNGSITLFWKISFHMALNVTSLLLINFLFNWKLPVLFVFIPLVFWSRLKLKKHTVAQLVGSLILNGAIILLFLKHVPAL